jgi:hypothetical protein
MADSDEAFQALFNQFRPLLVASGTALADPQIAAFHATYARNLFIALSTVQGFSDEQALRIVCAYGLGAGSARAS